jgi:hypothetical protein
MPARTDRCTRLVSLALLLLSGCYGGARGQVRFDALQHPASMSPWLHGPDGQRVGVGGKLRPVGRFSTSANVFSILYSSVPLSGPFEVGAQMNEAIVAARADGIVNVTVTASVGALSALVPLTLLPFWPGNTAVVVEGDLVQYDPTVPDAPLPLVEPPLVPVVEPQPLCNAEELPEWQSAKTAAEKRELIRRCHPGR